jgi:hypothetical protein
MRRAAEGCPSHDAPSVKEGGLCSCTPLTVPPPISVQRMIRDATGNTKYEFGDGSKALADGSKDAAEKAREAVVAMAHTVGIGQRTYARACEYELPRPCSVPPRPFTHPPTRTHQAAVAVLDAGGTAVEAGAAAKKVLDDSGYQCMPPRPRPPPPPPPPLISRPRLASPALPACWLPPPPHHPTPTQPTRTSTPYPSLPHRALCLTKLVQSAT